MVILNVVLLYVFTCLWFSYAYGILFKKQLQ